MALDNSLLTISILTTYGSINSTQFSPLTSFQNTSEPEMAIENLLTSFIHYLLDNKAQKDQKKKNAY